MDNSSLQALCASLGHSAQVDAFQCGREAGQAAKSQLREGKVQASLVLGPPSSAFQDFVEGVRLVTGDGGLIGLPASNVITNDIFLEEGRLVCLVQSDYAHVTVASTPRAPERTLSALTSLLSQHRAIRGNACHQFSHRGLILVDNSGIDDSGALLRQASVEFGLDGWILAFEPAAQAPLPLLCSDAVLPSGILGIEFLSQDPVGIGTVSLGQFDRQSSLVREAVKAAVREAKAQLSTPAGVGMLIYDFDITAKTAFDIQMDLKREDPLLPNVPLVGFQVASHGVKFPYRTGSATHQSITVLLLPL